MKEKTHAMIFKSFQFSSQSFSMRTINSVVVEGLYYGFYLPQYNQEQGIINTLFENLIEIPFMCVFT